MIEILSQDFFKILKLVVTYVQDNLLCFLVNFACLRLLHTVWQILTQFIFFLFFFFFLRGIFYSLNKLRRVINEKVIKLWFPNLELNSSRTTALKSYH